MRLSDPSVSRRHASLEYRGNNLFVTDLNSTNGTFVDGVRVTGAWLYGGELLRLGGTAIQVSAHASRKQRSVVAESAFGALLGVSSRMRRLYPLCKKLASTDIPVIIEGETGTGKEVLAESLHHQGPRADRPFVVFDCTTVAPSLIESALFGHVRGAFTGAVSSQEGVFEQANGGTLFIDEIGDLPLALQAKLLRALERLEIVRVGGRKRVRVDVRILSATRRDLDREVQQGRFRDDLFHRLAVGRIELPPLRNREGDVKFLAEHFARHIGGPDMSLPSNLLATWEMQAWPGNVRELRNAVARWLALGEVAALVTGGDAHPASVGGAVAEASSDAIEEVLGMGLSLSEARSLVVEEFERRYIARLLQRHGGNVTRAALSAGVARRHLQRLKAKFSDEG